MSRTVFLALAGVAAATVCVGQNHMPTPPVHTPPSPGTRPSGNTTQQPNTSDPSSSPLRNIYVNGRVQMDDGGPVPMDVVIEKVCSAKRQPLGYSDRKGHFSVSLAADQSAADMNADYQGSGSGVSGPISSVRVAGCEIRASLPGYRSDSVDIGSVRALDNPNLGTIVLHRMGGAQGGGMVSAAMLNAPKGALKDYQRGMEALRKTNTAAAEKSFQKAVDAFPAFAPAWLQLGRLAAPENQALARADFDKAIAADPKFLPPYSEIGQMLTLQKNWRETVDATDRALRMDAAGFPEIYYFNALAHFNLREWDDAEKRAREAVKVDADHKLPRAKLLLGYVLAQKGDLRAAAGELKAYVALWPDATDVAKARSQIERLEGQINAQK